MLRILLFLTVITGLSLLGVWAFEHHGSVRVDWLGYRIDTSLFFIFIVLLTAFITLLLVTLGVIWLYSTPRRVAKYYADNRHNKGMLALTKGFAAIAAGDSALARKLSKQAEHNLGKTPLTLLLHTQTAQLDGNDAETQQYLTYLLENKETEIIALKGMLLQAQKRGDVQEAMVLAERAYALNPQASWVASVLADIYKHKKSWGKAREMLEKSLKRKGRVTAEHQRMSGILLLSEAQEALRAGDAEKALNLSYRANKFLPGFVPAAVTLAEILQAMGKKRKAARILEQHWEAAPHPDLAHAYLALYADVSPEKQLKYLEKLVAGQEDHPDSHRIIARHALLMGNVSKARDHLTCLIKARPTVSAYQMQYELDKREGAKPEILQRSLDKAAHAERDAAWVCKSCGYTAREGWSQSCANCEGFDSFQWQEASAVHVMTGQVKIPA